MKYINFSKTESGILLLSLVMFFALFYSTSDLNHQQRLERDELCHQQMKEANQQTDVCSNIYLAEKGTAKGAEDSIMSWIVLLIGLIVASEVRARRLGDRVRDLEEKLNV